MSQPYLAGIRVGSAGSWSNRALTSHVGEFLAAALEIVAVFCLDGILNCGGHGIVGAEDGALDELDLTGHTTLETASSSNCTAGLLSLTPGLCGARLAALVWGRGPLGSTEISSRVMVAAGGRVDVRAIVALARVLCWPLGRVRLGQAVCGVRADVRVAVKRIWVGARWVLVKQRAADFVLIVPTVVLEQVSAG